MTLSPDRVLPSEATIEAHENYQKQSYRSRCYILGSGGPEMLQVPVVHGAGRLITEVEVDYSTPWVLRTERALDTAYETSAYYEYYRDEAFALLESKPRTLWELNLGTIEWLCRRTGIACHLSPSTSYALPGSVADDYRDAIHPKRPDTILAGLGLDRPYYQVFREKLGGFIPSLSSLDLLFNEGPGSIRFLA